jgi:DNA polymerase I-like protein with 3'-5' exonuclease and polymerase domains
MLDINKGNDIHTVLYFDMHGTYPTKEERRDFKRFVFGYLYGAGAKKLAKQANSTVEEAKRFIDTINRRYPGVNTFYKDVEVALGLSRVPGGTLPSGKPYGCARYRLPTGRELFFREYETDWGAIGFSPTEIRNYPIQAFATADIVPMVLGKLYRGLKANPVLKDNCLLINTVHDSVVFDVKKEVLKEALNFIHTTMSNVPQHLEDVFGIDDFNVRINVEVKYGPSWGQPTGEYTKP